MAPDPHAGAIRRIARARHRTTGFVRAAPREARRHLLVCRLRSAAVRRGSKVREWDWVAEFLRAATGFARGVEGFELRDGAHRSALQPVWRSPRARVSRRTATDWTAVLHQRGGAEFQRIVVPGFSRALHQRATLFA